MKILALDLGSNTGYASGMDEKILRYDAKNWIQKSRYFSNESFLDFFHWLYPIAKNYNKIVVERPNASMPGFHSLRVLFGMYGIVQMVCAAWKIEMIHVGATEVKKFWTGQGNALKQNMVAEANKRGYKTDDHNVCDAIAIYTYYMEVLRGKSEQFVGSGEEDKDYQDRAVG